MKTESYTEFCTMRLAIRMILHMDFLLKMSGKNISYPVSAPGDVKIYIRIPESSRKSRRQCSQEQDMKETPYSAVTAV